MEYYTTYIYIDTIYKKGGFTMVIGRGRRREHPKHVTGNDVTGSNVRHTPCLEVCSAHEQPEVAQYPPIRSRTSLPFAVHGFLVVFILVIFLVFSVVL
jgi:hypothetical protein